MDGESSPKIVHVETGDGNTLLARFDWVTAPKDGVPIVVYIHGFPDSSVHPTTGEFTSRLPRKLSESILKAVPTTLFVSFNASGIPGSDGAVAFHDKLISREVEDTVTICRYIRDTLAGPSSPVHLVGVSTGAIIASLLRSRGELLPHTVVAIAGLLNMAQGVRYDFTEAQMAEMAARGSCRKDFWAPKGYQPPWQGEAQEGEAQEGEAQEGEMVQVSWELGQAYVEEWTSGQLDVRSSVAGEGLHMAPFLVLHGEADACVPLKDGLELFEAAQEPKRLEVIPKANHLFTNTSHFKKAAKFICEHIMASQTKY